MFLPQSCQMCGMEPFRLDKELIFYLDWEKEAVYVASIKNRKNIIFVELFIFDYIHMSKIKDVFLKCIVNETSEL